MKTAEEILAEVTSLIASIHRRPQMHVGLSTDPHSADELDAVLWYMHQLWSSIQNRTSEFLTVMEVVGNQNGFGPIGFSRALRSQRPDASESSIYESVLRCWAEVDAKLGIDISKMP